MRAREQTRRAARRFCSSSLPEHIELTMPALSPTMEQGTIAEWKVNVGDEIGAGDVIAEVETDKATVAFESVEEGFLAKILMEPGTEVPVGTLVAIMAENEDDVAAFANYTPAESAAEAASPPATTRGGKTCGKACCRAGRTRQGDHACPSRARAGADRTRRYRRVYGVA